MSIRTAAASRLGLTATGRVVGLAVLVGLFISVESSGDGSTWLSVTQQIAVNGCLGLAVVVLLGYAGELSFAYGVLFGAAGYVSYFVADAGVNLWLSYLAGVVASVVAGAVIALPALRIRGLQLALATFGAGIAGIEIFSHASGDSGIVGLPQLNVGSGSVGIIDVKTTALFGVVILAVSYLISEIAVSGRLGRRWLLAKTGDQLAASVGVRVVRERMLAFMVSSFLLGIIGAVYPTMLGLLSPTSYQFSTVINVLIVAILGGLLRPGGALLGALLFTLLGQELSSGSPGVTQMVYGALLLVLLMLLPRGLVGSAEQALGALGRRGSRGHERAIPPVPAADPPLERAAAALTPVSAGLASRVVGGQPVVLRASGLTKTFGSFTAVDAVSFDAVRGEITGLIGSNGAGKSTLLDLMTGFKRADAGSVWLYEGERHLDLSRMSGTSRARLGVRRTFQHPALVPELTILDNITAALESAISLRTKAARAAAMRALELAGLADMAANKPTELPYGIVKLVDVCRLVATNPLVAFFDEPAAGLGAAELPRLAKLLNATAAAGAAVVLIEHNLDFISEISDVIYAMDFGQIIAHGDPPEVLASEPVANAYSLQTAVIRDA
jgi:ABC-type branched-subunit amino acid transport system ATPase component/ABC-type branched-subunit amino acid transport system permease subunit